VQPFWQVVAAVLLAFSLWLSIRLEETYTVRLVVPVRLDVASTIQKPQNAYPPDMSLTITARGYDLWQPYLGWGTDTFAIPVVPPTEGGRIVVQTNNHLPAFHQRLPTNIQLKDVYPDTFSLLFERVYAKTVPVRPQVDAQAVPGWLIDDSTRASPDKITVWGPPFLMDTLRSWPTIPVQLRRLSSTRRILTGLQPDSRVALSKKQVLLTVPVTRYTERTFLKPVIWEHLRPGQRLRTVPSMVRVHVLVPFDLAEVLSEQDFSVVADAQALDPASTHVRPRVRFESNLVKHMRTDPAIVQWIASENSL
jgi:hypothetical protein